MPRGYVSCPECGGKKVVECDCTGEYERRAADDDCYACGGSATHTCPVCNGKGIVTED